MPFVPGRNIKLSSLSKWLAFVCIMLSSLQCYAQPATKLDDLRTIPKSGGKPVKDTGKESYKYVDIFEKFTWSITGIKKNAPAIHVTTTKPDTVDLFGCDTILLSSNIIVAPALMNKVIGLRLEYFGSLSLKINNEAILATGNFVKDKTNKLSHLRQKDFFKFIVFNDSINTLNILFVPAMKATFEASAKLYPAYIADKKINESVASNNENFALGFYYLAFGVVFLLLYLFFKRATENLYFSLFCLFVAEGQLYDHLHVYLLFNFQKQIWIIFALEFLSIFFAKVLRDRNKSKIPLLIIVILVCISFLPFLRTSMLSSSGVAFYVQLVVFVLLICYEFISSIYFLVRGFGQKKWEAKVIVYIFIGAIVLFIVTPGILFTTFKDPRVLTILDKLPNIGLCILPLSAAIVLGRRNGLNQKELFRQVKSIEKLSAENLEKEKEKQLLLEDQNTKLEQKVNERTAEVIRQKDVIEIKNKAITDNMTYAQRIQSAILPDINFIYKKLSQSFVLYLPKDIVSGDFYACSERDGRILIIAGDCTGHGVSGAFMSMIGSSLLTQIINDKYITEPALILNKLNTSVIETFRQDESESNDGMDISVCSFDLDTMQLQYAGANRPLWLIRDNDILITRPDKYPIGGLQSARDRSFTNHTIQLQKNDVVYIFTDGYADQFGGANGKKMMTGKFKEQLLGIQHMSMEDQGIFLKEFFNSWKGHNEQVDDVLVIGVRV